MNPSCAAHNRHFEEEDCLREPLQGTRQKRTSRRIQTLSDSSFRLELELEANRRQRNERRQQHCSSGNTNGAIPQTTDIAELKIERKRSSKLNDLDSSSCIRRHKNEAVEQQTEKKAMAHRQSPHHIILERIHKRGSSSVPVSQMKDDEDDAFVTAKQQQASSRKTTARQVGSTIPPKSPRNGRRRSHKNTIRSIPSAPSERNQTQQFECQDSAASTVSGDSASAEQKSVSTSSSSSEPTYRGDSSQSGSSHYTEASSQNNDSVLSCNILQSGRNSSIQVARRKSARIILNESFNSFDHSPSNLSEVNLFENSISDLLPEGGVHGTNSLSRLHNSYSSLHVDDDDCDLFSPRNTTALHHSARLSTRRLRQRREDCLAELRQQQRQIAETLRHIKENPVTVQDGSHAQGLSRFHRWKNRNGAAA